MTTPVPRKPLVYLAVILPLLTFGGIAAVLAVVWMFAATRGIALAQVADAPGLVLGLSALSLWIPIALMLGNLVLRTVPSLRRTAETYARSSGTPTFIASQRSSLRMTLGIAVVALPAIAAVFLFAD